MTPGAWRRLPRQDRIWFLQNLNRAWDVHRFRLAPAVAGQFGRLVADQRVRVTRGRIRSLSRQGSGVEAVISDGRTESVEQFDRVINAAGACTDIRREAPPVLAGLIESGEARPDEIGLGLDVTPKGEAIRADGTASGRISVIGHLRRGVEWESIGVPEIRNQAVSIAVRVASFPVGAGSAR